jgi:recombination protein RecA
MPDQTEAPRRENVMASNHSDKAAKAKSQALEHALTQITKAYGKGAIMRLGKAYADLSVNTVSTGSINIDSALGIGGLPKGRITEIYGPEASGKTTIALGAVAQAQKAGGTAAFIDVEHALDPVYAKALGVDIDSLLISQPSTGEEALEIMDMLIRSGSLDIVVLDSVAALVPKAELEGNMGDSHVGLQARLMSQAMRKITGSISKTQTSAILINQIRMKIGVMFGSPETTSGGNALKFYASVRLDVRRIGAIKKGDQNIGNRVKVKVAKNKLAPPFKLAEFDMIFGKGISREHELIDLGVTHNLVDKAGSWYSIKGERVGQGKEQAVQYLIEHEELANRLNTELRAKLIPNRRAKEKTASEGDGEPSGVTPTPPAGATTSKRVLKNAN